MLYITSLVLISEKAMAPHSSTLAWKIPWMEEPGGLQSMRSLELDTTERLPFHFSLSCIGEGNGNPLQCSCLENPRDGGAWWAAVSGVAQSQTRLNRLSSSSSSLVSITFIWDHVCLEPRRGLLCCHLDLCRIVVLSGVINPIFVTVLPVSLLCHSYI